MTRPNDFNEFKDRLADVGVLALVALGGALCAVGATMWLYLYLGKVPFPVSAVVFGALLAAISVTSRRAGGEAWRGALPVLVFIVVVAIFLVGSPGGSVMYTDWRSALLLACGIGMPIAAHYLASSDG